jgi:hypothetical protein
MTFQDLEKEPQPRSIVPVFPRYFKVVMAGSRLRILVPLQGTGARRADACRATGTRPGDTRYFGMRNEEYTMELCLAVALIGAILAGAVGPFETRPSSAAITPPTELARLEPVRVVGTPFVPNVRPSER